MIKIKKKNTFYKKFNLNQSTAPQEVYDNKEDEFQNQIAVQLNLPSLATNTGKVYCNTAYFQF